MTGTVDALLLCQLCCEEARDHPNVFETDRDGDVWVYCRACDAWTSHPPEMIGLTRDETRRRY